MHAILALAQIHSSALKISRVKRDPARFTYHWYHAISSLNRKLSQSILPIEKDALWISAALISIGSFATTEASKPTEAWPLCPPSAYDLSWLKLCDGKKLVSQMTDPLRVDSQFSQVARELYKAMSRIEKVASHTPTLESLPSGFYELFELSKGPVNNLYYLGVMGMAEILRHKLSDKNFLPHLSFISILDKRFRDLLAQRDERALLLILYWYAKICDRRLWWMWKRSWTEGLAICVYLERTWARKPDLLKLLAWPRTTLTAGIGIGTGSENCNFAVF
jgi:hypothetical protein